MYFGNSCHPVGEVSGYEIDVAEPDRLRGRQPDRIAAQLICLIQQRSNRWQQGRTGWCEGN